MAWGEGGQELREMARVELSNMRQATYRSLTNLANISATLRHPEKGPQLREYVNQIELAMNRMEALLNR